jgi:hypothetical protein
LTRLFDAALDSGTGISLLERRGRLLEKVLKRPSDAAEVYIKLLQLKPDHQEAKRGLHACLRDSGRYQDLLIALNNDLQSTRNSQEEIAVRKKIAVIWEEELKNRWEALDAWKKVRSLNPNDREASEAVERLSRRSIVPPSDPEELARPNKPAIAPLTNVTTAEESQLIEEILKRSTSERPGQAPKVAKSDELESVAKPARLEPRLAEPSIGKLSEALDELERESFWHSTESERLNEPGRDSITGVRIETTEDEEYKTLHPSSAIPVNGPHEDSGAFELVDDIVEEIELDSISPISSLSVSPPPPPLASRHVETPASKPPPPLPPPPPPPRRHKP